MKKSLMCMENEFFIINEPPSIFTDHPLHMTITNQFISIVLLRISLYKDIFHLAGGCVGVHMNHYFEKQL